MFKLQYASALYYSYNILKVIASCFISNTGADEASSPERILILTLFLPCQQYFRLYEFCNLANF